MQRSSSESRIGSSSSRDPRCLSSRCVLARHSDTNDYQSSTSTLLNHRSIDRWGELNTPQLFPFQMPGKWRCVDFSAFHLFLYGSKGGLANSQSMSSLSMDGSAQSVPNAGSEASDLEKEEMISFRHAQQILYESPETRRRRKYAENMQMANTFDNAIGKAPMDFNELCALHTERPFDGNKRPASSNSTRVLKKTSEL
ncbi:unnamed protein product [Rodentolepis nana]|uniref:Uncharacterized protein n=1 Tax=Rodentolepis nana TaxID=102285 RepID=A0A3P7RPU8_RODNA|nr:unnamed protein product [Rodentolepis nana]